MIGSPDLMAFTRGDEYDEPAMRVSPGLPEEYSVPLFQYSEAESSPWSRLSGAKFSRDFVLISEFSEQVGPQPLLTIPDDSRVRGTFDLNYFSLRIMSVDYQASFVGHPPGSSYPKLNFVEDSKVVLGDSKEGAFAYVHHLTLYDLEARGFVRPFCMAYISTDEEKIMQQYLELSGDFSKASDCLKTGNRKAFANELEKKLKDLDYTRSVLLAEMEDQQKTDDKGFYTTQAIEKANELGNVEKSIIEHQDLLKQVQLYPYRHLKGEDYQPYVPESVHDEAANGTSEPVVASDHEENDDAEEFTPGPSYTPKFIKAKSSKCFDKKLKTLEELVDVYFFTQTIDLLTGIEKRYRGDVSYLLMGHRDRALLEQQTIVNFLFEDASAWDSKLVDRQYSDNLLPAQTIPSSGQEPENLKPSVSLESYKSSVESVHIKIEQELFNNDEDGEVTESSACDNPGNMDCLDVDTKGSISSGESIEVLQTEKSTVLIHSESQPCVGFNTSPQPPRRKAGSRRTISEDSIEVLSTCPSETVIPEDFRATYQIAINEEDPLVEDLDREQQVERGSPEADPFENDEAENDLAMEPPCCIRTDSSSPEDQTGDLVPEQFDDGTVVSTPPQPCKNMGQNFGQVKFSIDHVENACSEPVAAPESSYLLSSKDAEKITLDEYSDSTSYRSSASTCSDRTPSPPPVITVTDRQKRRAGQNALMFIRQYPFSHPAIYSILSGRTLVVLGEEEAFVKRLVTALSLFVPNYGHVAKPIKPWVTSPLHIMDFQKWKLIGLQRGVTSSGCNTLHSLNRYSRYVSILDADNKTLRCPVYRGSLLPRLADHRTQIRKGITYYMHVQSMLSQLSAKAFIFTFCQRVHLATEEKESEESIAQRRSDFLHQRLGLSQEDARIVEYLSELLKMHYLRESGTQLLPVLRFDYIPSFLYKI
ncbi:PREDICTED: Smith-Magenis syndrome chromosomal region candidate gene 8 protein [Nanorana parkeri]|uniref:Smith-Magenis syndrome chromosomal region candidate gene 8 protein n=1 Tax=Nanorana parkeri TaxID=125878 RepID=UPI0008542112|nr:PREDICTED: Smith-Magenis syndrome chromosomal region candidate gene 8 protein [Nanorana parkeri]